MEASLTAASQPKLTEAQLRLQQQITADEVAFGIRKRKADQTQPNSGGNNKRKKKSSASSSQNTNRRPTKRTQSEKHKHPRTTKCPPGIDEARRGWSLQSLPPKPFELNNNKAFDSLNNQHHSSEMISLANQKNNPLHVADSSLLSNGNNSSERVFEIEVNVHPNQKWYTKLRPLVNEAKEKAAKTCDGFLVLESVPAFSPVYNYIQQHDVIMRLDNIFFVGMDCLKAVGFMKVMLKGGGESSSTTGKKQTLRRTMTIRRPDPAARESAQADQNAETNATPNPSEPPQSHYQQEEEQDEEEKLLDMTSISVLKNFKDEFQKYKLCKEDMNKLLPSLSQKQSHNNDDMPNNATRNVAVVQPVNNNREIIPSVVGRKNSPPPAFIPPVSQRSPPHTYNMQDSHVSVGKSATRPLIEKKSTVLASTSQAGQTFALRTPTAQESCASGAKPLQSTVPISQSRQSSAPCSSPAQHSRALETNALDNAVTKEKSFSPASTPATKSSENAASKEKTLPAALLLHDGQNVAHASSVQDPCPSVEKPLQNAVLNEELISPVSTNLSGKSSASDTLTANNSNVSMPDPATKEKVVSPPSASPNRQNAVFHTTVMQNSLASVAKPLSAPGTLVSASQNDQSFAPDAPTAKRRRVTSINPLPAVGALASVSVNGQNSALQTSTMQDNPASGAKPSQKTVSKEKPVSSVPTSDNKQSSAPLTSTVQNTNSFTTKPLPDSAAKEKSASPTSSLHDGQKSTASCISETLSPSPASQTLHTSSIHSSTRSSQSNGATTQVSATTNAPAPLPTPVSTPDHVFLTAPLNTSAPAPLPTPVTTLVHDSSPTPLDVPAPAPASEHGSSSKLLGKSKPLRIASSDQDYQELPSSFHWLILNNSECFELSCMSRDGEVQKVVGIRCCFCRPNPSPTLHQSRAGIQIPTRTSYLSICVSKIAAHMLTSCKSITEEWRKKLSDEQKQKGVKYDQLKGHMSLMQYYASFCKRHHIINGNDCIQYDKKQNIRNVDTADEQKQDVSHDKSRVECARAPTSPSQQTPSKSSASVDFESKKVESLPEKHNNDEIPEEKPLSENEESDVVSESSTSLAHNTHEDTYDRSLHKVASEEDAQNMKGKSHISNDRIKNLLPISSINSIKEREENIHSHTDVMATDQKAAIGDTENDNLTQNKNSESSLSPECVPSITANTERADAPHAPNAVEDTEESIELSPSRKLATQKGNRKTLIPDHTSALTEPALEDEGSIQSICQKKLIMEKNWKGTNMLKTRDLSDMPNNAKNVSTNKDDFVKSVSSEKIVPSKTAIETERKKPAAEIDRKKNAKPSYRDKDNLSDASSVSLRKRLVNTKDGELVTEYTLLLWGQVQPCLGDQDRAGLECIHCYDEKDTFRVFPSSVRRVGGFQRNLSEHLTTSCRKLPDGLLSTLVSLERLHTSQYARSKPYGQEEFIERVWERLQATVSSLPKTATPQHQPPPTSKTKGEENIPTPQANNEPKIPISQTKAEIKIVEEVVSPEEEKTSDLPKSKHKPSKQVESVIVEEKDRDSEKAKGRNERSLIQCHQKLVTKNDQELVTDYMFLLMQQIHTCWAPDSSNEQAGFECIHCCQEHNSFRVFPSSVRRLHGIFGALHKHLVKGCSKCPSAIITTLLEKEKLQTSQYTHLKPTAQAEFFDHIWERLLKAKKLPEHSSIQKETTHKIDDSTRRKTEKRSTKKYVKNTHIGPDDDHDRSEKQGKKQDHRPKCGGKLVVKSDKELVTEYIFNLMNQVQSCYESDNSKQVGFECIHCCNEPDRFRVIPTSGRRLNGLMRPIHNHLARCNKAPKYLSSTLNSLERLHTSQYARIKPLAQSEFFERIWERLQALKQA